MYHRTYSSISVPLKLYTVKKETGTGSTGLLSYLKIDARGQGPINGGGWITLLDFELVTFTFCIQNGMVFIVRFIILLL